MKIHVTQTTYIKIICVNLSVYDALYIICLRINLAVRRITYFIGNMLYSVVVPESVNGTQNLTLD